ncbi:MAG TPA: hypothetical protein VJR05_14805, partial [Acidimicrobiia bacterium]|nr:hypothetical protein [Acidimicrobiia bacterium]
LQRTDYGVLCLVPGRISSNLVEDLVEELRDRGVAFLGATFLHRRGTTSGGAIRSIEVVDAPPVERVSVARLLQSERASSRNPQATRGDRPGGRVPTLPPKPARPRATPDRAPAGDSRTLFEQLQGTEPSEMQGRMLATLEAAERGAYEELATHLVGLISTLMTQPSAKSGFSRLAVEAAGSGVLPLHEVKGFDSVGTVLAAEFRSQLGAKLGSRFVDESSWVLGEGAGAAEGLLTLDQWAAREYFVRHMQLHDYQPLVWHLTSRNGTVQVLVDAARLDRDAIETLRATLVGQTIETLERILKAAVRGGRAEVVEQLGEQLTDARTFDISLGWLFEGTSPNARLVYPSLLPNQQPRGWNPIWTEGVKPNIAPLQRLGLLAAPVLTDDELRALRPAG